MKNQLLKTAKEILEKASVCRDSGIILGISPEGWKELRETSIKALNEEDFECMSYIQNEIRHLMDKQEKNSPSLSSYKKALEIAATLDWDTVKIRLFAGSES